MNIGVWLYGSVPLATSVIVPLGILLHYWRVADARPLRARSGWAEGAVVWTAAARGQLRRARIASALATVAVLTSTFGVIPPNRYGMEWHDFLAPMLAVLLCTAVLLTRPPAVGRVDTAAPFADSVQAGERRAQSMGAFGERWWFVAWTLCLAALVIAVCWAGLVSTSDDDGHYTMHTIEVEEATGGTTIAGWYFGVPVLISAVLLVALVLFAFRLLTAPPLAADGGQDLWLRCAATRTLLSLSGGAVVVTLAWVLLSIGNAAQIMLSVPSADDGGMTTLGSPLAPISVPVRVLGLLLQGIGIALVLLPLFSRLPRSTGVSVLDESAELQTEQGAP